MSKESIEVVTTPSGLTKVVMTHSSGHSAEVYPHGATVTSWKTPDGSDLIFTSTKAVYKEGKAIRGGIPIIFPQFSGDGPLPAHGIARAAAWELLERGAAPGRDTVAIFRLRDSEESRKIWNESFELRFEVSLGTALTTRMGIKNSNAERPFSFNQAFHTYFTVGDIAKVALNGFEGLTYLDNMNKRAEGREERAAILINAEIDRVYVAAPNSLEIADRALHRTIIVQKKAMPDSVVWNPWIEKSKGMSDLAPDEYLRFVCVEAGNIAKKVTLKPGESFECEQVLSYRPSA